MTRPDLPRILVVTSNNFNQVSGGGITLTNLFRGWPADRIANLHEDHTQEDQSVCQNFYPLSQEEIVWAWPFSLVRSWGEVLAKDPGGRESGGSGTTALSVDRGEDEPGWRGWVRGLTGDGIPRSVRITDRLAAWLAAFRPEIIYSFLGSMAQIRLTRELSRRYRKPVVVHIMDDWPAVIYRRGPLALVLRRLVQKEFAEILRGASLRLGICEDMCEEYRLRYGYPFQPFHNALDMERWLPYAKQNWKAGSPFIIRYVGSIVPDGQRDGLRDVCDAVAGLRVCGAAIELWVHAPREQVAYLGAGSLSREGFRLADPPGPDIVARVLSGADLLVLPFNFDARSSRYIRLSMPTKVPAYLVSGAPVLIYGPPGIATVRYAARDGWGHVVSHPGVATLKRELAWLMVNEAERERLGRRGQELARQNHDAASVRPAFWEALAACRDRATSKWVLAGQDDPRR